MKKPVSYTQILSVIVFLLFILVLSSCAKNAPITDMLKGQVHTYGFFAGLWHGLIAPFDLIGMLIWDDVTVFARNNNGFGYALGFLLGSGGWGFLGGKSFKSK
ncbi:MAG: hypothetical protein U0T82_02830 [Bacteroidales bacterium]